MIKRTSGIYKVEFQGKEKYGFSYTGFSFWGKGEDKYETDMKSTRFFCFHEDPAMIGSTYSTFPIDGLVNTSKIIDGPYDPMLFKEFFKAYIKDSGTDKYIIEELFGAVLK